MYPSATQQLGSSAPMNLATNNLAGNVCPPTFNPTPNTFAPLNLADHLHEPSWNEILREEFEKPYVKELESLLTPKYSAGNVRPPKEKIFKAFNLTPFDRVKVVILGQDPYPGDGQAMGLSFSVPCDINIPPSLNNIYSELVRDRNIVFERPNHGNLVCWATQGVLLLNTVLTVETLPSKESAATRWQPFTDRVIELISERRRGVVFMLWGGLAHEKENLIDTCKSKHRIIKTSHPSPQGSINIRRMVPFFGSNCFSVCNADLRQFGHSPIDWNVHTVIE